MKRSFYIISLLVLALAIAIPSFVSAQSTTDTVFIPGAQSLNISNIINADTSVTAKRVYVLDRGAIYYIEKAFEITHSSTFIAKGAASRPPVLAVAKRADGSNEEWYFKLIKKGIKVELNNLYVLSMRGGDYKTLGWSRAIHIGADSISLKMRNVVLEAFTEAGIRVDGADYFKLDVQNCTFRNFIHSSSYFGGQPFLTNAQDHPDTVIFKNNTFFACNSYIFSVRGVGPYNLFEHNTLVYGAVNPFIVYSGDNTYIKNNLFYDMHAWGGDPEQVIGAWFLNYPDTVSSCILHLRKKMTYKGNSTVGPEVFYANLGIPYDPSKRVFVGENNSYFFSKKLTDFYTAYNDTVATYDSVEVINGPKQYLKRKITLARWMNDLSLEVYDSLTNPASWDYSSHVSVKNNVNADPGFSDATVLGHADSLKDYVKRIATRKLDNPWFYKLVFPPAWPLPENLAYTNTALQHAGTDGKALGNLNWFPSQLGVETKISEAVPGQFSLTQNYPNPFNPSTTINFQVKGNGMTTLKVYNIIGQEVATLVNGVVTAGTYEVKFDASHLSSGVYFYTLRSGNFVETKKMTLMK